ncbi:hypothetical protein [Corynebacterium striatum]|uniref:hypothetical protein n=1 Tax=Corynebacterium striatum TaxID=43770 RepID=UPI0027B95A0D|nr:hypothetical protein [Corynebacterium striatum]
MVGSSELARGVELLLYSYDMTSYRVFRNDDVLDGLTISWGRETLLDAPAPRSAKFTMTGMSTSLAESFVRRTVEIRSSAAGKSVPLFRGLIDRIKVTREDTGTLRVEVEAVQQKELRTSRLEIFFTSRSIHAAADSLGKSLKNLSDKHSINAAFNTAQFKRYPDVDFTHYDTSRNDQGEIRHTLSATGIAYEVVDAFGQVYPGSYLTAPPDWAELAPTTFSAEYPKGMPTIDIDSTRQAYTDELSLSADLQTRPMGIVFDGAQNAILSSSKKEFRVPSTERGIHIYDGSLVFDDAFGVVTAFPREFYTQYGLMVNRYLDTFIKVHSGVPGSSPSLRQSLYQGFFDLIEGQQTGPRQVTITDKHGAISSTVWQTWEAPYLVQFRGGDFANSIMPYPGRWRPIGGEMTIKNGESTHRLTIVAISGAEYGTTLDTWNSPSADALTWEKAGTRTWSKP